MTSNSYNPKHADQFELETNNEFALVSALAQFDVEFPSEKACFEEICKRAAVSSIAKCHHCQGSDMARSYGQRTSICRTCKKTSWLTANTFFHRIRCARAWLAAIWLMEHGLSISSSKFHKLIGIAYSSALNIFRKLTTVIHHQIGEDALIIHSSLFLPVIGKRSRETPAREHPVSEQVIIDQKLLDDGASTDTITTTETAIEHVSNTHELSELQIQVYNLLSEAPSHIDLLVQHTGMPSGQIAATLTMLELEGLARRLPGDHYVRCIPHRLPCAIPTSGSTNSVDPAIIAYPLIDFVCSRFHRISRKYLQNYIAAFWCYRDRTRWTLGSLLEACFQFRSVSYREILDYVSPALVKVVHDFN